MSPNFLRSDRLFQPIASSVMLAFGAILVFAVAASSEAAGSGPEIALDSLLVPAAVTGGAFALSPASAAPSGVPGNTAQGSPSESFWGPIGSPTEQNTAANPVQGHAMWENAVNLPYNIAFFPLKAVFYGAERTVEFTTENDLVQRLIHFFPYELGPTVISAGVSIGSQDGRGGSLSMDVPNFLGEGNPLRMRLAGKTEGNRKATVGVRLRRNKRTTVAMGLGYRGELERRFYGLSPDSPEEMKSQYRQEVSWGGLAWRRDLGAGFAVEGRTFYSGVSATGITDDDGNELADVFAGNLPIGYRSLSEGYTVGVEMSQTTVEVFGPPSAAWMNRGRPQHGGLRRASVSWFEGRGNSTTAYLSWRAEAQHFVPLWHSRRALALRGFVARLEDRGGNEFPAMSANAALPDGTGHTIPFQRLLSNDDPDLLRGYEDGRFHGTGLAALTAEYRWPVWSNKAIDGVGADGYVFVDYGQVFNEFSEIDSDRVTTSWGGGVRLVGYGHFMGRVELGASEEGLQFRLRADQVFQFDGLGFFRGLSPVPGR